MADLGFLPAVRRLLEQTPRSGQRMLFSATLDAGVNVLVKRFLVDPATHEADSAQSPVAKMDHHVLHVHRDQRVPVLVDLTSAPGRTMVFTRTKHGAKALARQLNARGVPTVELHGNLAQNARTRNMAAFQSGKATTLVATDIAARGIHVDDVALVVHADPPAEHKAYLHRSGRTARAGAAGTVITLMTDQQVNDVRTLTRAAGIKPTTTKVSGPEHALLRQLAPGERVLVAGGLPDERPAQSGATVAAAVAAVPSSQRWRRRRTSPGRVAPGWSLRRGSRWPGWRQGRWPQRASFAAVVAAARPRRTPPRRATATAPPTSAADAADRTTGVSSPTRTRRGGSTARRSRQRTGHRSRLGVLLSVARLGHGRPDPA